MIEAERVILKDLMKENIEYQKKTDNFEKELLKLKKEVFEFLALKAEIEWQLEQIKH